MFIGSARSRQVLVGIASVGVNPVETYIRAGAREHPLPYIPGSDGAGKVLQVGEEVTSLQVSAVRKATHPPLRAGGYKVRNLSMLY